MTPYLPPSKLRRLGTMFNRSSLAPVAALASRDSNSPTYVRPRDKKGTLRLPVPINFAGTIWPSSSPITGAAREPIIQDNQEKLRDAVLILSQSTTARALLHMMTLGGYKIVFDEQFNDDIGSEGLCDAQHRRIRLRSTDNVYDLALVLAHESVHACQSMLSDVLPDITHRPEEMVKMAFAIEADAHAQTVQIALELANGDINRTARQVLFPEALVSLRLTNGPMVQAAEAVVKTRQDLHSGIGVAAAFDVFYSDPYLRAYYEKVHINWCEKKAEDLQHGNPSLRGVFRNTVASDWLLDHLTWQGKPYLRYFAPQTNLQDARHSGMTAGSIARISRFYKDYMPAERRPVLKRFPCRPPAKNDSKNNGKPPLPPING